MVHFQSLCFERLSTDQALSDYVCTSWSPSTPSTTNAQTFTIYMQFKNVVPCLKEGNREVVESQGLGGASGHRNTPELGQ